MLYYRIETALQREHVENQNTDIVGLFVFPSVERKQTIYENNYGNTMSLALVVEEVEGNEEVSYFGSYFIEKTDLPPKGGEN